MTAICFDHVSKWYPRYQSLSHGIKSSLLHLPETLRSLKRERIRVLEDVSFRIDKGETVGLIGPNGAGKSTTLALMAGVVEAEAGQVVVGSRVSPLLELGAGFHFDLTGSENIILHGVLLGLTRREVFSKMKAIITFSELEASIDQPLRTYSSGMIARLGFAIACHLDPEILLIDEILSVGDFSFQLKCNAKIDEFKRQQVTMVLVSHSMAHVQRLCDRVIWLEKGRIMGEGAPSVILAEYEKSAQLRHGEDRSSAA
ncbi:MAG: ABC transporter ATP-binding protein [Nitrospira sp.]|uniref:O-antigen export system ATP-binding protein RfbB n=2 Tax=Nitrospira defluvii TaxID=330214 RepID=A0ABM8RFW9_9BACT|nr:ABC transporter ATP-binding protein [Nitrospira sp.]CAE6750385.1 O-antigen export system ATP-binding protein RfbB [Nitrospira defluvii]